MRLCISYHYLFTTYHANHFNSFSTLFCYSLLTLVPNKSRHLPILGNPTWSRLRLPIYSPCKGVQGQNRVLINSWLSRSGYNGLIELTSLSRGMNDELFPTSDWIKRARLYSKSSPKLFPYLLHPKSRSRSKLRNDRWAVSNGDSAIRERQSESGVSKVGETWRKWHVNSQWRPAH